jgi:CheY-like chemotaxis protein
MATPRFPAAAPEPASRGRILLVEDDPDDALFTAHVLTRRGRFAVTHTPDPVTALTLAAAESFHLVLTDLDLPVMSGIDLIAALRRLAPALPVVLLVPAALSVCPTAALRDCRAEGILAKPVPADDLLATALSLIDGGRAPQPG